MLRWVTYRKYNTKTGEVYSGIASGLQTETVAQILHPGIVGAPAPDRARRVDHG